MSHHRAFDLLTRLLADPKVCQALRAANVLVEADDLVAEYDAEEAAYDAHLEAMADADDMRAEMAAQGGREWDNAQAV